MLILILESSTTSAKAMLYKPGQGAIRVESAAYSPACSPGEIGAQDAERILSETLELGRAVCGDEARTVDMVALSGTWHNLLVCDEDIQPLTPAYTWTYNGASSVTASLRRDKAYVGDYYQRTGCMVHNIYPAFKLLALQQKGLDLRGKYIFSQSSYMFYRLTGCRTTTDCTASGSGLLNVRTRKWDAGVLKQLGLYEEQMEELSAFRAPRPLLPAIASRMGLRDGIPVLPPYPDGALNQVAAGALNNGRMTFSLGTSGALRFSIAEPLLPDTPSTWCYLSPDAWLSGAATSGACNCVDWFRERMFDTLPYEQIERKCEAVDINRAPIFLPFLFGERCPGWNDERTGGFSGLKAEHTAADLYISVLEGVIFNLYQCYELLSKTCGTAEKIHLSGGILHSPVWRQMCCDIFGRELLCATMPHASMIGAAVLAMETAGLIRHISDYEGEKEDVLGPDPEKTKVYQKRYQRYLERYHQSERERTE